MNRKTRLLEYINSAEYIPLKLGELKIVLDVPVSDYDDFASVINELESEGSIIISKRGRILPVEKSENKRVGILQCNTSGRFGFVISENSDDIYISSSDMGMAIHGDKVLVKIMGSRGNKPEGSVIKVLERSKAPVIGVVITKKGKLLKVRADDARYTKEIFISELEASGAVVGQRVSVSGIRINPDGKVYGKITALLGDCDDLRSLIEAIIIENKIKTDFDRETLEQCAEIDEKIQWDKKDREDLRSITTFTIDGELARDFDDAVSIEMSDDGLFKLGVHIADVSEYVTEQSPLDNEAFVRGTSVYLPDRVIPMLPEKLSNGVCSLNPGVDRLTLTVFMDVNENGDVVNHRIIKSVINSKERLTYTDINKLLTEGDAELEQRYSHILSELKSMEKLAEILRNRRFRRGAIDFDFPESEIVTDSEGLPVEVRQAERGISNRMIEEFMLLANETVAEFAFWAEIPFIYRSHEAPSEEKLTAFKLFLKPFGLILKGKIDENNPVRPKAFEQIIDKVRGTAIERIVSKTMLRSLMKADYRVDNTGHFGLAAKYYCHFTSPIRRYPDLVVHRSIKRLLDGQERLDMSRVSSAAKNSSEREISAEISERDCDDLMKAAYMLNFIGMDFEGVISGVTGFGMFVELTNGIEGLIRIENMVDDYYVYNEAAQSLTGERNGNVYSVGDTVSVFVAKSDMLSRRIDFVLSEDVSHSLLTKFDDKHIRKKRRKR